MAQYAMSPNGLPSSPGAAFPVAKASSESDAEMSFQAPPPPKARSSLYSRLASELVAGEEESANGMLH